MNRLRSLQAFEAVLILAFLFGVIAEIREPKWPNVVGIVVNLLWQYAILSAIRKQKKFAGLDPSEQAVIMNRQRAAQKLVLITGISFAVVLMISIGLFLSHVYAIRTFMFLTSTATLLTFCFLVISLTRLQKRQG